MRALVRKTVGGLILGGGVILSMASNDPAGGDRTDGECPAGEICSPDTPNGLYFGGANLGDEIFSPVVAPQRTAVGGKQTIHVFRDEDANTPFSGFEALAGGAAFRVLSSAGNAIDIEGAATGDAYLRLVDPENDELYDRISLDVAEVARVALVPSRLALINDKELFEAKSPAVVYHTDNGVPFWVVALFDASDVRLVDQSLALQLPPGLEEDTDTWDRVTVVNGAPLAAGEHVIGFTLGSGDTGNLSATVVDTVDAVVWVPGSGALQDVMPEGGVLVGQDRTFCFRAENGGRPVIGAPWTYSSGPNLMVHASTSSCVTVTGVSPGLETLTVTSDEVAEPFDIPVSAAAKPAGAPSAATGKTTPPPRNAPTAGERAEGAY